MLSAYPHRNQCKELTLYHIGSKKSVSALNCKYKPVLQLLLEEIFTQNIEKARLRMQKDAARLRASIFKVDLKIPLDRNGF